MFMNKPGQTWEWLILEVRRSAEAISYPKQTSLYSKTDRKRHEMSIPICSNGADAFEHMEVSKNWGYPKSSIFSGFFPYTLSILGYLHFRKPPYGDMWVSCVGVAAPSGVGKAQVRVDQ